MRKRWLGVLACASAAILGAGVTYAAIPDAGGVIHGCYLKRVGTLRVIDASTDRCTALETAIQWSQTGPQGLPGSQGIPGPKGDTGPAGSFSGVFESSNHLFSLAVEDSGIVLKGPSGKIELDAGSISIDVAGPVSINGAVVTVDGAVTKLNGGIVQLNGCAKRVAGTGDLVDTGGGGAGAIVSGSSSVCVGD